MFNDMGFNVMDFKEEKRGADFWETLTVKAELANLEQVREMVERGVGAECASLFKMQLAAEEIFVNIASYAYKEQEKNDQEQIAEITCSRSGRWFFMTFKDYGKPFNMLEYGEPEWKETIDQQEPGGFGISLVRQVTDEVSYKRENGANILTVKKELEWKKMD